ncbi:MAG: PBP1A family penicillin-binding protein [Oscillospiraceae bacterium]|nr:PBP1A family penicillin-binding protein [Oscillospiraceae bacterium]
MDIAREPAAEKRGGKAGRVLGIIGTILLIGVVTGLIFVCIFAFYVKTCITPSLDLDLNDFTLNQSSIIYYQDSNGDYQKLTTVKSSENRIWVDGDQIPQHMKDALVAIEDKRFYTHKGVDWFRTAHAALNMFTGGSTFGGSTITQQLIKNLTQQDDITVQRKLLEIFQALDLEKNYDKDEILEYYLNAVYFGEGCYGVQTAAQTYFGKDAKDLSVAESAAIVGITNLPTYYDPFYSVENNKERQENVLREMYKQGYLNKSEYEAAKSEELEFVRGENSPDTFNVYSYYEEVVLSDVIGDLAEAKGISRNAASQLVHNAGYEIYACIDKDIQAKVDAIYTDPEQLPKSYSGTKSQLQSAIVIIDQTTGEIKALSGGTGEKTISYGLNRATGTTRPPGSSIKPIAVYGPAVEYGLISPSTMVLDADETHVQLAHTSWYPKNSPNTYDGIITITTALQKSKNTVAAQIMDKLTPSASLEFLRSRLGVTSLIDSDADYAAMALGEPHYGITVREMAQAYTALANDGVFTYSRTYTMVKDRSGKIILDNQPQTIRAFSQETARTMTYMLNNAATYGTGSESRLSNMPVAGKTGTTTSNRDRWFCGYTPYYTCAVWTGYDTPETMSFSGNPATQIWQKVMSAIHADLPRKEFNISYGGSATGIFGSRDELEEQALTEEERKQKEEEEKKKQEEEEKKNNEDDNGGGTVDDIFANFRDLF